MFKPDFKVNSSKLFWFYMSAGNIIEHLYLWEEAPHQRTILCFKMLHLWGHNCPSWDVVILTCLFWNYRRHWTPVTRWQVSRHIIPERERISSEICGFPLSWPKTSHCAMMHLGTFSHRLPESWYFSSSHWLDGVDGRELHGVSFLHPPKVNSPSE